MVELGAWRLLSARPLGTPGGPAVRTAKHFLRDDFSGALVLLVVVSAAIVLMTHVRLSDIDDLVRRGTYAIASAARTVLY